VPPSLLAPVAVSLGFPSKPSWPDRAETADVLAFGAFDGVASSMADGPAEDSLPIPTKDYFALSFSDLSTNLRPYDLPVVRPLWGQADLARGVGSSSDLRLTFSALVEIVPMRSMVHLVGPAATLCTMWASEQLSLESLGKGQRPHLSLRSAGDGLSRSPSSCGSRRSFCLRSAISSDISASSRHTPPHAVTSLLPPQSPKVRARPAGQAGQHVEVHSLGRIVEKAIWVRDPPLEVSQPVPPHPTRQHRVPKHDALTKGFSDRICPLRFAWAPYVIGVCDEVHGKSVRSSQVSQCGSPGSFPSQDLHRHARGNVSRAWSRHPAAIRVRIEAWLKTLPSE